MTQEFVPVATVLENGIKKQKLKKMELSQKYYFMHSPTSSQNENEGEIFHRMTSPEIKEMKNDQKLKLKVLHEEMRMINFRLMQIMNLKNKCK